MVGRCRIAVAIVAVAATALMSRCASAENVAVREQVLGFTPGKHLYHNENATMSATGSVMTVEQRRNCTWIFEKTFPGGRPFREARALVLETENPPESGGRVTLKFKVKGKRGVKCVERPWTKTIRFDIEDTGKADCMFNALVFTLPAGVEKHTYALLSLDAEKTVPPSAACSLAVDTGNPLHLTRGADEPVSLVFSNRAERAISFSGNVKLSGPHSRSISFPVSFCLPPGGVFRRSLDEMPLLGVWRVTAHLEAEGTRTRVHATFARIPRHVVTPQAAPGVFRIGLNYHMRRYSPIDRAITLDALVASGAKLVRGIGATFANICRREGEYDWKVTDECFSALWERGIAINAGIWDTPRWAADESHRTNSNWLVWIRSLPRGDLYAQFAERLASRYGTKIAYYELGNEWDLLRPEALSIDEGISAQKIAYRAIKKACPDAVVIPNGWACCDSDDAKVRQKWFHERLMSEARGFYDVHPVHIHGPFSSYRKEIRRFFKMRGRLKIDVPWYANETAESTVFGNDETVADCVWQKVLWSWAHGSRDYIWYNLRATGYEIADWEQGYGLMTADYEPRASYAAFAALTHIFNGLGFERMLADDDDRGLFVFSGLYRGRPVKVVAGWDGEASTELKIASDAHTAQAFDIYGNASPQTLDEGLVSWKPGRRPGCLVLQGARSVSVDALPPRPPRRLPCVKLPSEPWQTRRPDAIIDKAFQMTNLYKADPERAYRLWQGPHDLSVRAWLTRGDDSLHVHVEVTDDIYVCSAGPNKGDSLKIVLGSPETAKAVYLWEGCKDFRVTVRREDVNTIYDASIPWMKFGLLGAEAAKPLFAQVFAVESDGEGNDGWMHTTLVQETDKEK